MEKITASEAKTRFGQLLKRVANGEGLIITRHGEPVARLIPAGASRLDDVRRSVQGLRDLQKQIRLRSKAKLTGREVRSSIEDDRL
jgi:prevent-host-death family protein